MATEQSQGMTVTYTLTEDDFVYLFKNAWRQGMTWGQYVITGISLVVLVGILLSNFSIIRTLGSPSDPYLLIPFGLIALGILSTVLVEPVILRRYIKRIGLTIGQYDQRTIRINAAYFEQITPVTETKAQWKSLVRIVDEKNYIHFLTSPTPYMVGYYIPKRAFATPDQAQLFFQTATAYWQGKTPPNSPEGASESTTWPPPPRLDGGG